MESQPTDSIQTRFSGFVHRWLICPIWFVGVIGYNGCDGESSADQLKWVLSDCNTHNWLRVAAILLTAFGNKMIISRKGVSERLIELRAEVGLRNADVAKARRSVNEAARELTRAELHLDMCQERVDVIKASIEDWKSK